MTKIALKKIIEIGHLIKQVCKLHNNYIFILMQQ